jgi:hypothetical protein
LATNKRRINNEAMLNDFAKVGALMLFRWPAEHRNCARPYPDDEAIKDVVFWEYFVDEAPSFTDIVNRECAREGTNKNTATLLSPPNRARNAHSEQKRIQPSAV